MIEPRRNLFGYVIPADPTFAKAGENPTGGVGYQDGRGKSKPAPGTTLPDGTPRYAKDGVTTDWWSTHDRPIEVPIEETKEVEPSAIEEPPAKPTQHFTITTRYPDPDALPDPEWMAFNLQASPVKPIEELPPWARPDRRNPALPYKK
jgi:hypothetical protein